MRAKPYGIALALALALGFAGEADAQTVLKIATLAPEGSAWMKISHAWGAAIEKRTEGRVKVKFYAGGVQGDERDVLRKIKLGQLHGAAVTGIGLSAIHPEARVVEAARSYEELDALRAQFGDRIRQKVEEKGLIVGSWGDVGPVHIFSNRPIKTLEDLKQVKMWLWSDDPLSKQFFDALGLRGVPMGVPDVLPGLSTGAVDAFLSAPLPTLALQWGTKAKYMSTLVISQATGATVIAKKSWDAISPADQQIIREESKNAEQQTLSQSRKDNKVALETLKTHGLEVVPTPAELAAQIEMKLDAVARKAGEGMDAKLREEVELKLRTLRKR